MKGKILSIVIPIFKVEKYLHKCVDSVLASMNGMEKEYEIILVDDGSPDQCSAICDEYGKNHEHIFVIHKNNAGVSAARNDGIRKAVGEFVAFVDPDDYVLENFNELVSYLKKYRTVDVFQAGFDAVDEKDCKAFEVRNRVCGEIRERRDFFNLVCFRWGAPWFKVVSKEFLLSNNLFFNEDLFCGEDHEWTVRLWFASKTYYMLPLSYYCYLTRRSREKRYYHKSFLNLIESARKRIACVEQSDLNKADKKVILRSVSLHILNGMNYALSCASKEELNEVILALREDVRVYLYPVAFKKRAFVFFSRVFGLKLTMLVLSKFK